jgi:spore maturation protein CgeB
MSEKKILLVGISSQSALEVSYKSAAVNLGYDVMYFDIDSSIAKYIKLGKLGDTLHRFLPIQAWTMKMNRELIIAAKNFKPDYLFYFTGIPLLYGTLATIKTILPKTQIVWIWPDTPLNLPQHSINSAKLVDITATYSSSSVNAFRQLGFNNVVWVPLGGDPFLHKKEITSDKDFICDISFVGGWRREREKTMKEIVHNFSNLSIEVHGPSWKKNCQDPLLKKHIRGNGFYGPELGTFFNKSRININQIDDTNYPAANMRFFEVCIAGGLQLASSCPEMQNELRHREHLVYYNSENELMENIQWIMDNPEKARSIRKSGQELVLSRHTYSSRIQDILASLENR